MNNQIVTAVAERTVMVNREEYLPICTSAPLELCDLGSCSAPSGSVGEIRLMKVSDINGNPVVDSTGVTVSTHNYACNSMTTTEKGDLLVSGRLTVSSLSNNQLKNIVYGSGTPPTLYLDDIAYLDGATNQPVYADGYLIEPSTYVADEPQKVGWRSGLSAVTLDGTLSLVSSNTVRLEDRTGAISEKIDVGIHLVDLPSKEDRVLVSIQTDPININNTTVTSTFVEGVVADGSTPPSFIPGNYIVNQSSQRTMPTPLPSVGSAMSEEEWYQLFELLQKPKGDQGLNQAMPALENAATVVDCANSYIQTCKD
ncbi:MAG: hypothetical protein R3A45_06020 [Bdellovibrionota bacterium]